jgi:uncharacterized C2H2 Zn-finger protein
VDLLLVLAVALALLAIAFAFGGLFMGEPVVTGEPEIATRCPVCGKDQLETLDVASKHVRQPLLLCGACGAEFREQRDGTLTLVVPS